VRVAEDASSIGRVMWDMDACCRVESEERDSHAVHGGCKMPKPRDEDREEFAPERAADCGGKCASGDGVILRSRNRWC